MKVTLNGDNKYGIKEVETQEGETPLDAYHIVAALCRDDELTKDELTALNDVYGGHYE